MFTSGVLEVKKEPPVVLEEVGSVNNDWDSMMEMTNLIQASGGWHGGVVVHGGVGHGVGQGHPPSGPVPHGNWLPASTVAEAGVSGI